MSSRIIAITILFLLIVISGFRLTRGGASYSTLLLTLHKLIALGAVILYVTLVVRANQIAPLQALHWLAFGLSLLFLAATIVSGGLVSALKDLPVAVRYLHHALPYLSVLAAGTSLYLTLNRTNLLAGI